MLKRPDTPARPRRGPRLPGRHGRGRFGRGPGTGRRPTRPRIPAAGPGIEGAIGYITKPFTVTQLREAVKEALEGDPEPIQRRHAQHAALERLARLEKGGSVEYAGLPRPHLTRFEAASLRSPPRTEKSGRVSVNALSVKQVELLTAVSRTRTVRDAADQLDVSRSNVYASLRRIARKLDVLSVPELVRLARDGGLDLDS